MHTGKHRKERERIQESKPPNSTDIPAEQSLNERKDGHQDEKHLAQDTGFKQEPEPVFAQTRYRDIIGSHIARPKVP